MPFIFQHFNESANTSGFLDFLKEHYADSDHSDQDHEHGKLPFKHANDGCSNHPVPNISPVIESSTTEFFHPIPTYLQLFLDSGDNIPASYSGTIWQPPKFA